MMNNITNRPDSGQNNEWIETHQDEHGTYVTRFGRGFDGASDNRSVPSRRRPLLPLAAAFLAGVMTIGGFMYAADHNNWFNGTHTGQAAEAAMGQEAGITTASAAATASTGSGDIAAIYESASPAVVKIDTFVQQRQSYRTRGGIWFEPNGSPQGGLAATGTGTGFIFQKDGYIMTNQHVVADADEIQVTLQGDTEPYTATVVGQREDLDVAILKIEPREAGAASAFPTVKLGDSDKLSIGDMVVAIGNPYGLDQTLTVGVLSAKERPIQVQDGNTTRSYEHLLQTDASINPGNSGGPLLNADGEVVGMNSAGESEAQGIGFAIPTTTMKSVIEEVLGGGANV